MNSGEIIHELKKQMSVSEFAYEEMENPIENIGKYDVVSRYGGTGKGETWYRVFYFIDHNIYIKVDGFYSSYGGAEFDDWEDSVTEVRPSEKTITVYN